MSTYPFDSSKAVRQLSAADPALAIVMEAVGPFTMRYEPVDDLFAALLRAIVYQQLSGKAASTIHGRVLDLFDGPASADSLTGITEDALRGAGLSRAKAAAARDLAAHVLAGEVPGVGDLGGMTDQEIRDALTVVRGIGPWTVDMLLMFRLGRPDVLPATDLGVRKGFAMMHGLDALPEPADLRDSAEIWRPWRSVASWYMWRTLEIELPD